MKKVLEFDRSPEGVTFILDLEKEIVAYSSYCLSFLEEIKEIILKGSERISNPHVPDENRKVTISTYYSKIDFLYMLRNTLGLEGCGTYMDVTCYNVPEELTIEKFEKAISYEGVVDYFRNLDEKYLPFEFKKDLDLWRYFKPCPVCCGGEYVDESCETKMYIDSFGHLHLSTADGKDIKALVKVCPICGRLVE